MNAIDMAVPVTRGELREELALIHQRIASLEHKHGTILENNSETLATHGEALAEHSTTLARHSETLDQHSTTLARHTEILDQHTETLDQHTKILTELLTRSDRLSQQLAGLSKELAGHAGAIQEAMRAQVAVIDDKYNDLPGRVHRLEVKVFSPRRR